MKNVSYMEKILESFKKNGWAAVDFLHPAPVFHVRERLQTKLNQLDGKI